MAHWVVVGHVSRYAIVGLVGIVGCIDIKPFRGAPIDAGVDASGDAAPSTCASGDIATYMDGPRRAVCGPGYVMRFSDAGYHFPNSFVIGSVETSTDGDDCGSKDGFGIAIAPVGTISGHAPRGLGQMVQLADLRVEVESPFFVKVVLDWTAQFDCGLLPHGRSTFSFFRGGRIVRYDHVVESSGVTTANCHAACTSSTAPWDVGTYATFVLASQMSVTHSAIPNLGSTNTIPDTGRQACIDTPGYRLGIAWDNFFKRRLERPLDGALAVVEQLQTEAAGTLPGVDVVQATAFQVDAARTNTCAVLESVLAPWNTDPQLKLQWGSSGTTTIGLAADGTYGGERVSGPPGMMVAVGPTTMTAVDAIQPRTVVWLVYDQSYQSFAFTKNGVAMPAGSVEWATVPSSTAVVVFLRDGLAPNDVIVVTPSA